MSPPLLPLEIRLVRAPRPDWPGAVVRTLVTLGRALDPPLALVELLRAGGAPLALPAEDAALTALDPAAPGGLVLVAAEPQPVAASIRLVREAWAGGRRDLVVVGLPQGLAASEAGIRASLKALVTTLTPAQAGVYDPVHFQAVRLPPEAVLGDEATIVPPAGAVLPGPPPGLPPEAARLAAARPPAALDLLRIPEAVWWLNYWSGAVLAHWPEALVRGLPWHAVEPLADGLLLQLSPLPPSRATPEGFARAAEITQALELQALQRRVAAGG